MGRFVAYGTPAEGCPDPVLSSIEGLRGQVAALLGRSEELEERLREIEETVPDSRARTGT
jgi:hypothetical protein